MGTIAIAFLGNHAGEDGIYAFSREILFRTAGEWAAQILPSELPLFYFHAPNAPNIPQAQNEKEKKDISGARANGHIFRNEACDISQP